MAGNNSSAGMDVNGGKICRSVNIIAVKSNDTQRPLGPGLFKKHTLLDLKQ